MSETASIFDWPQVALCCATCGSRNIHYDEAKEVNGRVHFINVRCLACEARTVASRPPNARA
jgi:ribosomal protein S27E